MGTVAESFPSLQKLKVLLHITETVISFSDLTIFLFCHLLTALAGKALIITGERPLKRDMTPSVLTI